MTSARVGWAAGRSAIAWDPVGGGGGCSRRPHLGTRSIKPRCRRQTHADLDWAGRGPYGGCGSFPSLWASGDGSTPRPCPSKRLRLALPRDAPTGRTGRLERPPWLSPPSSTSTDQRSSFFDQGWRGQPASFHCAAVLTPWKHLTGQTSPGACHYPSISDGSARGRSGQTSEIVNRARYRHAIDLGSSQIQVPGHALAS